MRAHYRDFFHRHNYFEIGSRDIFDVVAWPRSGVGKNVLPAAFGVDDWTSPLEYFDLAPNFALHPTLNFITQPVRNKHFTMSVEGARLEPGWNDDFVRAILRGKEPVIFALGGSTMLGHGVGANHTIPAFMNQLLRERGPVVLNLGSQAYDQTRAIEKLLYLLRIGYRPQQVAVLTGWNDIMVMARSNLRTPDKLTYHGFATNKGEIAFTPGDRLDDRRHFRLFLEALPLYRLLQIYQRGQVSVDNIPAERDTFIDGFDFYEAEFVFRHWAEFAERRKTLLRAQLLENFSANLRFLDELSKTGLKVRSFYQPIGLLDEENPFVGLDARTAPGYDYVVEMDSAIRQAIASGELEMIDISQALKHLPGPRYVDVAHYSPEANKVLAATMLQHMLEGAKAR